MEEVRKNPALKLIQGSSTDDAAVQEACLDTEAVILGVATAPVWPVSFLFSLEMDMPTCLSMFFFFSGWHPLRLVPVTLVFPLFPSHQGL